MGRRTVLLLPWIAAALAAALVVVWLRAREAPPVVPRGTLRVQEILAGSAEDAAGFARAEAPREFSFPADHGPHDGFRTEWWYFTGNLVAEGGRRFGYQLTFFRSALSATPAPRTAAFAASHAWMAHFALSDVDAAEFHDFERFAREGAGLAGASATPTRVWLRDWTAEFDAAGTLVRLAAREGDFALDLRLRAQKAPILQGDAGLSRKDAAPGNASYYYSITRLATMGRIELPGEAFAVEGDSWLDREWSSGALGAEQTGWDWFALQLDDGTELVWYRLRRADGAPDPFDAGALVLADGSLRALRARDLALVPLGTWESPRSRGVYPAGWRLAAPGLDLELSVTPATPDQELGGAFRYWEGAVDVVGSRGGRPVAGRGYVELVGYAPDAGTGTPRPDGRRP